MTEPAAAVDLRSLFLGPKGENADVLERLLLEALRDHVFWRRNFHPEDGFRVREQDKRTPGFEASISVLSQELLALLAQLKAGVPFFSPRYVGHMTSDLTMASLVAYFATMLYNPNNVAAEASPVTTRMELEVAQQLASMVGYPAGAWGHLTSGGTVANLEALWVARNVKYLPVAVRWAAEELGLAGVEAICPGGERVGVEELSLWQLLNLEPGCALDLAAELARRSEPAAAADAIRRSSLAALGYQEFGRRLAAAFGDALPPAVVLVPSTAHYSFEKVCRTLGIGSAQLVHVPVDGSFRLDPAALERTLAELTARRQPVIACITVIGTTEESAVDRVDRVVDIRREAAGRGMAFHLHADGAWGGYAISTTRRPDGSRRSYQEALADYAPEIWPEEAVYRALCAVEETDSVTIDPHKLGFIPYPAGAVCFRDVRSRDLVAIEAPYLFHPGASEWGTIGRFVFEGSKPGAAAAAVWMSHKVLPLDERGYGRLVGECSRGALALQRRLAAGDWSPFRVVPLPPPDLNIVCFAIGHPSLASLAEVNAFVDRVYRAMSVGGGGDPRRVEYFVTKTELRAREYGEAAVPLVEALGFTAAEYRATGGVAVVRSTVMDPFLASGREGTDYVEGYASTLRRVMEERLVA